MSEDICRTAAVGGKPALLRPGRPSTSACHSPLRYTAAACAAVAAASHMPLVEGHLRTTPYLGVAFLLFVAAAGASAAALLHRDTAAVWRFCAGLGLAAVVTYVASRSVGLPGHPHDVGRWADPLGLVSLGAEALLTGLALGVLARDTRPAVRPEPSELVRGRTSWAAVAGAGVLVVGLATSGSAVSMRSTTAAATGPGHAHTVLAAPAPAGSAMSGSGYWEQVAGGATTPTGRTRTYYVGTDEVVWDYAPTGANGITGEPFDDTAKVFVQQGPGRIGSKYVKCLYRSYSDASFSRVVPRPADERYLGIYGPVIRAEVGDTIKVVFRNTCRIPTSVHPHGVFYTKSSEGAPYSDSTGGGDKADDAVPQGGRHTYTWEVPQRAGPGPHDGTSVMWMYHSHTDEVGDTYAGLMGPMVITARGQARADGSPKDVDREVFELFTVMNENQSPYLQDSLEEFAEPPFPPDGDEEFEESNLMHSVNGYVFGNQPMVTLRKGERVRWYVMGMGTEVDLHTPHWHGNDVLVGGMRMDVVNLLPASMVTADMVPDNRGTWLFHCHVNDHITAGMMTRYRVV